MKTKGKEEWKPKSQHRSEDQAGNPSERSEPCELNIDLRLERKPETAGRGLNFKVDAEIEFKVDAEIEVTRSHS